MKRIPLTQGKVALVSDCDYKYLMKWKWYYQTRKPNLLGYAARQRRLKATGKQRAVYMHVEIMRRAGRLRPGQVDHCDQNGLHNYRSNLRMATRTQQKANTKRYKNNTSGYKGVHWRKDICKWCARIGVNGKKKHLGYYESKEKAAEAYDRAAEKYFGKFSCLNNTN
jgi:hypothetical protein